jgi:hypothetical protein
MILYKIEFEVDNGASYTKDTALVIASNSDEAKQKLKEHISSLDSETSISRIFQTQKFCNEVFTGQHGMK